MTFEKIGDSYKNAVSEQCDYNHALLVDDKIWLFGKKFVSQPSFNWGHHVAFVGTYAIAFNTAENKWEDPITFPAISNEENLDEKMFVLNGAPYILLYTAFGEVSLSSLYKWTGTSFERVNLQGFNPIPASEKSVRVTLEIADGHDDKARYVVSTMEHQMRVARLTFSGNGAKVEHLFDIPREHELALGQATSAAVVGSRLLVSFGVHGCGFRWMSGQIVVCDLDSKTCQTMEITSDSKPQWGFNGAKGYGLTPSDTWVHAAGTVPKGMSGGTFDGSVWELSDLKSTPTWKKLAAEIPSDMDGEVLVDSEHGNVYCIGKTQVGKVKIA